MVRCDDKLPAYPFLSVGKHDDDKVSSYQTITLDKHADQVSDDNEEDLSPPCGYKSSDGSVINTEILMKYLKEVKESEGFHITEYPGHIDGLTDIIPLQSRLDTREKHPEEYDDIMDLAAIAVKTYNKKHRTNFKVTQIDELNMDGSSGTAESYYITFTAVHARRPLLSSAFEKLLTSMQITMLTILLWIFFLPLIAPFYCMEQRLGLMRLKLKSAQEVKARKYELEDDSAPRMTFEALASDDKLYMKREVTFCRVAKNFQVATTSRPLKQRRKFKHVR